MKRIGICVLALIFTVGLCVPTFATVNQSSANLNVGLKEGKVHNRINSEKNIIDYEQGNSQSVKAKLEAQVKGILEDNDKGRFIDIITEDLRLIERLLMPIKKLLKNQQ